MKRPIFFLLALSFFVFYGILPIYAQKIIFTEKVDSLGRATSMLTAYQIDPIKGDTLFVVFQAHQALPKPKIYVFIDKKDINSQYKEFDNQRISIKNDSIFTISCPYLFTKEGHYKITIADAEKKEISSNFISISFRTHVVFSEQIDENDLPLSCKQEFELGTKIFLEVYSFLKLSKPMDCRDIFHQIYRYQGKDYSALVVDEKFAVKPEWEYTYLKAKYEQKGKYKVLIKTSTNKILGINYLEIK